MNTYGQDSTKEVGIWIRVSTEDQARGESPLHHEKRARLYAEAKDWNVRELYNLSGVSGKSVMEHPEAKRMLKDIESGHISGLIFSKLARLARNTRELLDFADIFRGFGADLISLQESIDTSSPAGRLFYTMIAAMAEWEREEIAERVKASIPIRAKLGKRIAGAATFGYQWLDGKLVPHPEEAPVRKLLYELFAEHKRRKTVARILNERGYRTRKGAKFSDTTVTRLLQDPTAKGLNRANYTYSQGQGKPAALKPEEEWVFREVEPIVSIELWDECNAILAQQVKTRKPARKAKYLFAGYVFCECGKPMYARLPTPIYKCKKCGIKIPIDDLEALFHEQLSNFFMSEEEIAAHLQKTDEGIQQKEELLGILNSEAKKIYQELDNAFQAYSAKAIDQEEYRRQFKPLSERRDQIEEQIPELQAQIDIQKINHLSSGEMISSARDLYGRWKDMEFEEKRVIVEAITESIIIKEDEVEINLHYIPQSNNGSSSTGGGSPSGTSGSHENSGKKATQPHGFIAAIN